jgi:hypothetical protein
VNSQYHQGVGNYYYEDGQSIITGLASIIARLFSVTIELSWPIPVTGQSVSSLGCQNNHGNDQCHPSFTTEFL